MHFETTINQCTLDWIFTKYNNFGFIFASLHFITVNYKIHANFFTIFQLQQQFWVNVAIFLVSFYACRIIVHSLVSLVTIDIDFDMPRNECLQKKESQMDMRQNYVFLIQ